MNNIRTLRKLHGLTQADLADILNVKPPAVTKWETGVTVPTVDNLNLIFVVNVTLVIVR